MLKIRRSEERGHADHGWLDSYHTFSFADYYDPDVMGFRVLRVINDDRISGGRGFPTHPHRDMEIITYVIEGSLEHQDTMGTHSIILPGEVQQMSAGTGVQHSEFNHEKTSVTRLLQIWILPDRAGHKPRYGQKSFTEALQRENLVLVASGDGAQGSVPLHQDVQLYAGKWSSAREQKYSFKSGRYGWIQIANGSLEVNGQLLKTGDGVAIAEESEIALRAHGPAEFLLFDLP